MPTESPFSAPLADASEFPAPLVAPTPHPGWADMIRRPHDQLALRETLERGLLTRSGRNALAHAASLIGVGEGSRVALPAYHCPSLVEPFMAAGATIDYYRLGEDLQPDAEDVLRVLERQPTVWVLVRYFGLRQHDDALERQIRASGARLIHDCAHALYALPAIPTPDYAIASITKFLPVDSCGVLTGPGVNRLQALTPPDWRQELRGVYTALQRAGAAGAAWPLGALAGGLAGFRRRATSPGQAASNGDHPRQLRYYDPAGRDAGPSRLAAHVLQCADFAAVASVRRRHYRRWVELLSGVAGARVLYRSPGTNDVPYVVPLWVDAGEAAFRSIRQAGVPLYRWEELAPTPCSVAAGYRTRLLQLPCHQGLSDEDIGQLASRVVDALKQHR